MTWQSAFIGNIEPYTVSNNEINLHYNIGSFGPCDLVRMLPGDSAPEELFFRYYFRPKAGFQCRVEGKKMPGLAGRGGPYGNGGNRTTGKMEADGLSGWSARMLALTSLNPGDPISVAIYLYHVDQTDNFGDILVLDAPPMIEGTECCIEQYVKMNTIDMSHPDARGNGVGARDGIIRIWSDGVLAREKLGVCFRHHPLIKITEAPWMVAFHGGTQPAERQHDFAMSGFVVSRKYIGPRAPIVVVPDPVGASHVATTISLNTLRDANVCQAENTGGSCAWSGNPPRGMLDAFNNWCSMILVGRNLVTHPGGEGNNGPAYAFNLDTRKWNVITVIPTNLNGTSAALDPAFNRAYGAFGGQPNSPWGVGAPCHTYDCLEGVPTEWGGGPDGSIIIPTARVYYVSGGTMLAKRADLKTGAWYPASTDPAQLSDMSSDATSWVRDANNKRYLGIAGHSTASWNEGMAILSYPDAKVGDMGRAVQSRTWFAQVDVGMYPVQRQAPEFKRVLIVGDNVFHIYDSDKCDQIYKINPVGAQMLYGLAAPGLAWDSINKQFWLMPRVSPTYAGSNNDEAGKPVVELFIIRPPAGDWITGTWNVVRWPITGAVGYVSTGRWKGLDMDPVSKSLIWCSSYAGAVYSLRVA